MRHIHPNSDIKAYRRLASPLEDWKARHDPEIPVPKPRIRQKPSRYSWLPFASGALALVLLLQGLSYASSAKNSQKEILGAATSAYGDLNDASGSLAGQNFQDAQVKFTDALTSLHSAQDKLSQFKALGLVASQVGSANHVLSGASYLATAGQNLTSSLGIISELKVSKNGVETENLADKLKQNQGSLQIALENLRKSSAEFEAATDVPEEYRATLQTAKDQVRMLTGTLESLVNLEDIYIGFFGSGPRVYLLVFQNPDEIRATGGFIGTYGVLKISDGKIEDLKIDSIYDLDGHIYDRIAAPGPFQPYIQKWGIRDANWFVDFPTSAKKLLQFFESGSQTADGVLAFTPSIFEDLLRITGPIKLGSYNVTLDAYNFQDVVQFKTSVDFTNKLNPKQMLADFAPVLLDRLANLKDADWLELLQTMQDNLLAKNILLYSKDSGLEKNIENLRMSGNVLPSDGDYLYVVNTNLSGTKTDLSVAQKARLNGKVLSDGTVIDTLTIERQNNAADRNADFLRVLVPSGSTLVSSKNFDEGDFNLSQAKGFDTDPDLAMWDQGLRQGNVFIRTEAGKTEFSGWVNTEAGQSKTVTLTYVVPFKLRTDLVSDHAAYSLLLQKQPGLPALDFSATLDSGTLHPYWISKDAAIDKGKINFAYNTSSDQYWAVLLTR